MAIPKDRVQTVREALRNAKVMLMAQLTAALLCSRRSAQRRLSEWGAITSYNHNGRYYALPEVAQFDGNGIWRYGDVCFSRVGNLKRTVSVLIDVSEKGLTARELSTRLHLEANRVLCQWTGKKLFLRERLEGVYRYFSADPGRARVQRRVFLDSSDHSPGVLTDALAVPLLLALMHHPEADADHLGRTLASQGVSLPPESINDFLQFHGLVKKTPTH